MEAKESSQGFSDQFYSLVAEILITYRNQLKYHFKSNNNGIAFEISWSNLALEKQAKVRQQILDMFEKIPGDLSAITFFSDGACFYQKSSLQLHNCGSEMFLS